MIVPVQDADRVDPEAKRKSFAEHLLAFPGGVKFERDGTPLRGLVRVDPFASSPA